MVVIASYSDLTKTIVLNERSACRAYVRAASAFHTEVYVTFLEPCYSFFKNLDVESLAEFRGVEEHGA